METRILEDVLSRPRDISLEGFLDGETFGGRLRENWRELRETPWTGLRSITFQ